MCELLGGIAHEPFMCTSKLVSKSRSRPNLSDSDGVNVPVQGQEDLAI